MTKNLTLWKTIQKHLDREISPKKMAQALGRNPRNFWKYKRGESFPDIFTCMDIAKEYGCDAKALFRETQKLKTEQIISEVIICEPST